MDSVNGENPLTDYNNASLTNVLLYNILNA